MKRCVVCDKKLTGKQRRFCSNNCKQKHWQHPERYPEPEPVVIVPESEWRPAEKVLAAATTGEAVKIYEALRDRLAREVDAATEPRDVSVLSSRLMEVVEKISLLTTVEEKGSALDELRQRRGRRAERPAG